MGHAIEIIQTNMENIKIHSRCSEFHNLTSWYILVFSTETFKVQMPHPQLSVYQKKKKTTILLIVNFTYNIFIKW